MPQVPTLDNFSVAPQAGSAPRVEAPPVRDVAGEQLQRLGGAIQQASSGAADIFRDAQAQANALRVDDAVNRLKERALDLQYSPTEGFTTLKGRDALFRPDGGNLIDEYGGMLKSSAAQIGDELTNPVQRRMYEQAAAQVQVAQKGALDKHFQSEYQTYNKSVNDGIIDTAARAIMLAPTDTENVNTNLTTIKAATARTARLLSLSAEQAENAARTATSRALFAAVKQGAEQGSYGAASDFMKLHANDMTAEDLINGKLMVDAGARAQNVTGFVGSLFDGGGGTTSYQGGTVTNFDRMVAITADSESGNKNYTAGGRVITSSAGARYAMQVMPATARDPGHGIKPVQDDTPEEHNRVGRQLLQKLMQKYGGDPAKAWGAYNWGEGNMDAYLKTGKGLKGQPMPAETRNYIEKNTVALQGGVAGGKFGAPRASLNDLYAQADRQFAGDPKAISMAHDMIRERYSAVEHDSTRAEQDAQDRAYAALVQNGGQMTPAIQSMVPGHMLPGIVGFSNSLQAAQRRDDNQGDPILWAGLKTQIAEGKITDPAQLLQYAPLLSKNDFRSLTGDVVALKSGDQKKIDSYSTVDRTLKYIRGEMLDAGIDWSPDSKDPEGAKRFGTFQDKLLRQIGTLEQVQGKPLNADEARTVALTLLKEVPNTGGWFSSPKRGYELGSPMFPLNSVPRAVQQRAVQALRASGFPATERNVRRVISGGEPLRGG